MRRWFINLPDQDLAYLPEGTEHFDDYVEAVDWAQDYAALTASLMMEAVVEAARASGQAAAVRGRGEAVNCHHNYVAREHHFGKDVLVTRKGAVRARLGDLGIIPGSMGARSYIVRGLGNDEASSSSHGAGRAMSRTAAKKPFTLADHAAATAGIECRKDADVIDETPGAYKSIDDVMAAQRDLVDDRPHAAPGRVREGYEGIETAMLTIDGSIGEGGGQICARRSRSRSSRGRRSASTNIRARRARPGLMRQHLTAVQAAAADRATRPCSGAESARRTLEFEPRRAVARRVSLRRRQRRAARRWCCRRCCRRCCSARAPSTLIVRGRHAQPAGAAVRVPRSRVPAALAADGREVTCELERTASIRRAAGACGSSDAGARSRASSSSSAARFARAARLRIVRGAAVRRSRAASSTPCARTLGWDAHAVSRSRSKTRAGRATCVADRDRRASTSPRCSPASARAACAPRSSRSGRRTRRRVSRAADVPVGRHLADQLLLPLALAGGGSFLTLSAVAASGDAVRDLAAILALRGRALARVGGGVALRGPSPMSIRLRGMEQLDPVAVPLPHGTEVITRVDRARRRARVPQGAVGRVIAQLDGDLDVQIVGVGVAPLRARRARCRARRVSCSSRSGARPPGRRCAPCIVLDATVGSRAWGLADDALRRRSPRRLRAAVRLDARPRRAAARIS